MKTRISAFLLIIIMIVSSCANKQSSSPKTVILLIWDGLPINAIEQMDLPNMQTLAAKGSYYKELHVPLPAHPKRIDDKGSPAYYPLGCSLPNPVAMTGTVFIGRDSLKENMIQHSFDKKLTAFTVNCHMYEEISGGYNEYIQLEKDPSDYLKDELPVEKAIELMQSEDFAYIRIHMQGPGWAGHIVNKGAQVQGNAHKPYAEPEGSLPWLQNIWYPNSPFIQQSQKADSLLGVLVNWLEENNKMEETVLFVMGDHGQADAGAHSTYTENSSITSLLIVGNGIKKGKTYDYAEVMDIIPTISKLCQVPNPKFATGRILEESFINGPEQIPAEHKLAELNNVLTEHHKFIEEQASLLTNPDFRAINNKFYTIESVGAWHFSFNDISSLLTHNNECLSQLKEFAANQPE